MPRSDEILACPQSGLRVHLRKFSEAVREAPEQRLEPRRAPQDPAPIGATPTVMFREDGLCAYPVLDDIPLLLRPEVLEASPSSFDLTDPKYAEAYAEMDFYNRVAAQQAGDVVESDIFSLIAPVRESSDIDHRLFPEPWEKWLDVKYDLRSQWDAYRHLGRLEGKRVLQLGGTGVHALKFLYAGASEAWLVSPMLEELRFAHSAAAFCGLADRFHCVLAVGEELPFEDGAFDAIYSGGSIHHTVTDLVFPECVRILGPGGRFAAVEPWRAPFYRLGIWLFGQRDTPLLAKRDVGVFCRPMTRERAEPLQAAFPHAEIRRHGALTRYPLIALGKLGWSPTLATEWKFERFDDAICTRIPQLRRLGSSAALLGAC